MKPYIRPQIFTMACYAHHMLAGSDPKMAGGVYRPSGSFVEGTDFGYGGDGGDGEEADAKRIDVWDTWDD